MKPGDHIISSYGYANKSFEWARAHGGKTFVDAGNSHPANFWEILSVEHARWNSSQPPVALYHYRRSLAMMKYVDYVLSPSTYVTNSFLAQGFSPSRILRNIYPVDLNCFAPSKAPRPASRPLTLISTGMLSLRKGTPYLLEAFRIVRKKIPDARLLLTSQVQDNVKHVLRKYSDIRIEWLPSLPHAQLAERLRDADIFVLPSLEEGLARTVIEAMACGLPAIVTPNTGANDWIVSGQNGEVVPIRNPGALAEAILEWADRVRGAGIRQNMLQSPEEFSFEHFRKCFLTQLREKKLIDESN